MQQSIESLFVHLIPSRCYSVLSLSEPVLVAPPTLLLSLANTAITLSRKVPSRGISSAGMKRRVMTL